MSTNEAVNLLKLEGEFDLIKLKAAYRSRLKEWHPDLNQHRPEKATVMAQKINAAYDALEAIAQSQASTDKGKGLGFSDWFSYVRLNLVDWEKQFKKEWQYYAYGKSCLGEPYAGLNYSTCIENFRRGAMQPKPEWFKHALFNDTPENRRKYREHLLKIAPNPKMAEVWARKYFNLEFGDGSWIFYIEPGKEAVKVAV
jgi:hypothetical protein